MSLHVLRAGLQTTVQAAPRRRFRQMGMPWAGPADPVNLALANCALGNAHDTAGLEITYGGFSARFETATWMSLAGAPAPATLNGHDMAYGVAIYTEAGATLVLEPPPVGVRSYLAVAGGITVASFMDSQSTYLPARLGGFKGRALKDGDVLPFDSGVIGRRRSAVPDNALTTMTHHWRLRLQRSDHIEEGSDAHRQLFSQAFEATRRSNRMGLQIEGQPLTIETNASMDSVPVFPGTVQSPPDGKPFILMNDAQTTGGYPRLGHIARVDRYKLGQIRPGDRVQFLEVDAESAQRAYLAKATTLSQLGIEGALY